MQPPSDPTLTFKLVVWAWIVAMLLLYMAIDRRK